MASQKYKVVWGHADEAEAFASLESAAAKVSELRQEYAASEYRSPQVKVYAGGGIDWSLIEELDLAAEKGGPDVVRVDLTVTVRTLLDLGLWLTYCEASGASEWAINEGRMDGADVVSVPAGMLGDLGSALVRIGGES